MRLGLLFASLLFACTALTAKAPKPLPPLLETPPAITFIEDDYPRALADARETNRPLFIDEWASWCHSCLSMREYVFRDAALRPIAEHFVWLSIDTEKSKNDEVLARFPVEAWPTIWIVTAEKEKPVLKWVGTATASELLMLLQESETDPGTGGSAGDAIASLLRGDHAAAEGDDARAIVELKAALAAAPEGWPRRARAVAALTFALQRTNGFEACLALAVAELPDLAAGTARAGVAMTGLACGRSLPKKAKARQEIPVIADIMARMAADRSQPLLADDRSELYAELVDYRIETGDAVGAKVAARAWASFLEEQAAIAPTKEARTVFDSHRLLAYLALGEGVKAIPMLKASESDFPSDYNPPARLAKAYLELKRLDEAHEAIERALSKAYGPRKLRLYLLAADIETERGDTKAANKAITDGVTLGKSLTLTAGYAKVLAELEARAIKK